jgi:hypothetical protein
MWPLLRVHWPLALNSRHGLSSQQETPRKEPKPPFDVVADYTEILLQWNCIASTSLQLFDSGRPVWGVHYHKPVEHWNTEFESHSGRRYTSASFSVRVVLCTHRPWYGSIPRPKSYQVH